MFEECRLDILGFRETKLREEGNVSFGNVRGDKSGVSRRGNTREEVAVHLSERM